MTSLKLRPELYEHAVFPSPQLKNGKLDEIMIFKLAHSLGQKTPESMMIGGASWGQIASSTLGLSVDQANVYFRHFAVITDALSTSGTTEVYMPGLVIYMLFQCHHQQHVRSPVKNQATNEDFWPSNADVAQGDFQTPPSPRSIAVQSKVVTEPADRFKYVQNNLHSMLELIATSHGVTSPSLPIDVSMLSALEVVLVGVDEDGTCLTISDSVAAWLPSKDNLPLSEVHQKMAKMLCDSSAVKASPAASKGLSISSPDDHASHKRKSLGKESVADITQALSTDPSPRCALVGESKKTVHWGEEVNGTHARLVECHNCYIYILGHVKYLSVLGCTNCTVMVGAVSRVVSVEHCEKVKVVCTAKSLRISNSMDCALHTCVSTPPLVWGEVHRVQLAPFNTVYLLLEEHMKLAGISGALSSNRWQEPVAAVTGAEIDNNNNVTPLPISSFVPFSVPFSGVKEGTPCPCEVPDEYLSAVEAAQQRLMEFQDQLSKAGLESAAKEEVQAALHAKFKEWLLTSGNMRQIQDLMQMEAKGATA